MSSYRELLREGQNRLKEAGIADAATDAWYLLAHVTGRDRNWYYFHMNETVAEKTESVYKALVARRAAHEPLQYLTGRAYFMGLELLVNEQVLIPRQDTELLAEEALKRLGDHDRVLDLCTGSGCILLSLCAFCDTVIGTGSDCSAAALAVAKENSRRLSLPACWIESNLFEQIQGKYDMIIANPPYISTREIPYLMEEVRLHEPLLALDGGIDGLDFYRRIVREAPSYLTDTGWLLLEIGMEEAASVSSLMRQAGFGGICVCRDLAGLDRVVIGRKGQEETDV